MTDSTLLFHSLLMATLLPITTENKTEVDCVSNFESFPPSVTDCEPPCDECSSPHPSLSLSSNYCEQQWSPLGGELVVGSGRRALNELEPHSLAPGTDIDSLVTGQFHLANTEHAALIDVIPGHIPCSQLNKHGRRDTIRALTDCPC